MLAADDLAGAAFTLDLRVELGDIRKNKKAYPACFLTHRCKLVLLCLS